MDKKTPASSPTAAITSNELPVKTTRSISRVTERTVRMDPLRTALTPEKTADGSAMKSTKEMGPASPGQAIEMTNDNQSVGQETLGALKAGGLFGKSKDQLKDESLQKSVANGKSPDSQVTPSRFSFRTAKSNKKTLEQVKDLITGKSALKTPMNTVITPNGLSCTTTKSIKTEKTPIRPGLCPSARQSLFPDLKVKDPKSSFKKSTKSVKFSDQQKQKKMVKNSHRSDTRSLSRSNFSANSSKSRHSVSTADSFEPPATPRTCQLIPPHVLAEAKAEQNKVVLTSATADGSFRVVIQLKMKLVSASSDPQALITKMVVVNGKPRYSA